MTNQKDGSKVQQHLSDDVRNDQNGRTSSEEHPSRMTTERNKHQIRRPHWIIDYVSGDELSDDDNTANLILFADCDPIAYEDAEKDLKWQKAMDIEIESIKRNDTWELTDLPQG